MFEFRATTFVITGNNELASTYESWSNKCTGVLYTSSLLWCLSL